ncbi:hypothetical protein M514_06524 [Trichuris suis]|uniref:Peptidase A2 domain-containing protein n=1 Tax=Trichuris suis TaxID=68888 RepID=A0A085N2X1_9BILA|nr:hypothetical protein M513_06524 [Trichuris suis]KFD63817.1 hypothetical protein M514_06524 [Trichuris suis]
MSASVEDDCRACGFLRSNFYVASHLTTLAEAARTLNLSRITWSVKRTCGSPRHACRVNKGISTSGYKESAITKQERSHIRAKNEEIRAATLPALVTVGETSRCVYVTDHISGIRFLADTGASVSVLPSFEFRQRRPSHTWALQAVSGTPIQCFGTRTLHSPVNIANSQMGNACPSNLVLLCHVGTEPLAPATDRFHLLQRFITDCEDTAQNLLLSVSVAFGPQEAAGAVPLVRRLPCFKADSATVADRYPSHISCTSTTVKGKHIFFKSRPRTDIPSNSTSTRRACENCNYHTTHSLNTLMLSGLRNAAQTVQRFTDEVTCSSRMLHLCRRRPIGKRNERRTF